MFSKRYIKLSYIAKSYGLKEVANYWEQVILMNDHQKRRFAHNIVKTLYNTVSDKKVAFLGWAFKKDTNDTRESPAVYVAEELLLEQAKISVWDPKVKDAQIYIDVNALGSIKAEEVDDRLEVSANAYEACKNSHAIAVLTEWEEFNTYDWQRIYNNMHKPAFVFDGRGGVLDKNRLQEIGFVYYRIGEGGSV